MGLSIAAQHALDRRTKVLFSAAVRKEDTPAMETTDNMYLDQRLSEKAIRDGHVSRADWAAHLAALPDSSDNVVEYDEEGNPTNLPQLELKTLEIKPAEPEPKVAFDVTPRDPLADAWDELPAR